MKNITLIGDSIFDNALYVDKGKALIDHLKKIATANNDYIFNLQAIDGATVETTLQTQIPKLTPAADTLLLSCGGNNALMLQPFLLNDCDNIEEALSLLHPLLLDFRRKYHALIKAALASQAKRLIVCTIYDAVPEISKGDKIALSLFNDAIYRSAQHFNIEIIELRQLLTKEEDFSGLSPIEPSAIGGQKLAMEIWRRIYG